MQTISSHNSIRIGNLVFYAYWWLGLPLVLFLFTWFRPEIGIPFGILSIWAIWKASASSCHFESIAIHRSTLLWIAIISFIWIFCSGIGGFFYQLPWDHAFRNALFYELVNNPFPVIKQDAAGNNLLLCYYHAFWILPALIAKLTGSILIGNIAQLLYAWIGMMIVALIVFSIIGKAKVWIIILMFAFCGWEYINDLLVSGWCGITDFLFHEKDLASEYMSAPSWRILTCYNYNQGIAVWMILPILYINRHNVAYLVIPFCCLAYFAPFPTIGIVPFIIVTILKNWRNAISINNIIGICLCILIAVYFMANKHGNTPHLIFGNLTSVSHYAWLMIVFIICSYGVFMPFIWQRIKRNRLFWGMMLWSLIVPMFVLTDNDYNMGIRASIPFMCYFTIVVLKEASEVNWHTLRGKCFAIVLAIGLLSNIPTMLLVLKGETGCIIKGRPFAAIWLERDLFDKNKNECYDNFISENESLYTRYFIVNTNKEHNPSNN